LVGGFISARVAISSVRFFRRAAWSISTRTRLLTGVKGVMTGTFDIA
jgi:hypothetical protein